MQKIVKTLCERSTNLVFLRGPPGVGKSTLLHNAFQYILERKYFTGGVIMVDLKNSVSIRKLFRSLKLVLIQSLGLAHGDVREQIQNADNE